MHNIQVSIYTLILALFSAQGCFAQKGTLNLSGFSEARMTYKDESKNVDSARMIKRSNDNAVRVSFYEEFEDSVVLYINKKQIWSGSIYMKNNPFTSSGWCGFDLNFELKGRHNTATIKLISQKEYIQFSIDQEFPLYIIQRYDKIWTVRALKSDINDK